MTVPLKRVPPGSGASLVPLEELLRACADEVRLTIVRSLQWDSFSVSELCDILEMKQPAVSHHLRILVEAGLLTVRREGTAAFYRRVGSTESLPLGGDLVTVLLATLDELSLDDMVADRIATVKRERSRRARDFFNQLSSDFSETQELIATPGQYLPTVFEMLKRAVSAERGDVVIEIGAGRGEFLPSLLELFREVLVVDVAEEMLALACRAVPSGERHRVTTIHGDSAAAVAAGMQASHIVCSMVLHHVPSPADIFADCAQMLRPGGSFVVADLCRHEQTWAIERCGDMWLGFEPIELAGFAAHAGLVEGDSAYFALRNGFQVQVRRFDKVCG